MQSHHIPSYTAVEKYLEDQGVELDSKQKRKLKKDLGAVLLSIENHKITRTYGSRAIKTRIADAKDLLAAVDADIENLVGDLGVSREQGEQLRGALKDHVKAVTAEWGAPCG
ncbi:MAG: hypothetical protein ABJ251_04920 [Paracoccaceae bacterium]